MKCLFAIVFVSIILMECIHAVPMVMAGKPRDRTYSKSGHGDNTLVLNDSIDKLKVCTLITDSFPKYLSY